MTRTPCRERKGDAWPSVLRGGARDCAVSGVARAVPVTLTSPTVPAPSDAGSTALRAAALGGWLVGLDVWLKIIGRTAACPGSDAGAWSIPSGCEAITVAGPLSLLPAVREGLPGMPTADPLGRQLGALAVIAIVTIATIAIGRAASRQPADVLALGCAWAGAIGWAAPILVGPGIAFTELTTGTTTFGIADISLVVAALWLVVGRLRS